MKYALQIFLLFWLVWYETDAVDYFNVYSKQSIDCDWELYSVVVTNECEIKVDLPQRFFTVSAVRDGIEQFTLAPSQFKIQPNYPPEQRTTTKLLPPKLK